MVNPIRLLLELQNTMGPQLAEATGQLQVFKAEATSTTSAVGGFESAASGAAGALGTVGAAGLVAAAASAAITVAALGFAFHEAAERLMELGQEARQADLLGQHLDYAGERAERFYLNITEAKERMGRWGDSALSVMYPALDGIAERFNRITESIERVRLPDWISKVLAVGHALGAISNLEPGQMSSVGTVTTADTMRTGYIHGPAIEDFIRESRRETSYEVSGISASAFRRSPKDFAGDYNFNQPSEADNLAALAKDMKAFSDATGKAEPAFAALVPQISRAGIAAHVAATDIVNLGLDMVRGTAQIGSAFRNLVADVLSALVEKRATDWLTGIIAGAIPGGSVVSGLKNGTGARQVTVNNHYNALSMKDILRSQQTGELYEASRANAISARLA